MKRCHRVTLWEMKNYVFLLLLHNFLFFIWLLQHSPSSVDSVQINSLTFAFFSKRQGRWNSYLSFLSRTHVHYSNVQALDDLSNAQHKPLRMPSFVWSTETEMDTFSHRWNSKINYNSQSLYPSNNEHACHSVIRVLPLKNTHKEHNTQPCEEQPWISSCRAVKT